MYHIFCLFSVSYKVSFQEIMHKLTSLALNATFPRLGSLTIMTYLRQLKEELNLFFNQDGVVLRIKIQNPYLQLPDSRVMKN